MFEPADTAEPGSDGPLTQTFGEGFVAPMLQLSGTGRSARWRWGSWPFRLVSGLVLLFGIACHQAVGTTLVQLWRERVLVPTSFIGLDVALAVLAGVRGYERSPEAVSGVLAGTVASLIAGVTPWIVAFVVHVLVESAVSISSLVLVGLVSAAVVVVVALRPSWSRPGSRRSRCLRPAWRGDRPASSTLTRVAGSLAIVWLLVGVSATQAYADPRTPESGSGPRSYKAWAFVADSGGHAVRDHDDGPDASGGHRRRS